MTKNKEKVLVLGANGFIGSHTTDLLVSSGYLVRAFDRFNGGAKPKFRKSPEIEVINGDFNSKDDLKKAVAGIDYIIHLISTTNPATAEENPLLDIDTNIRSSVELFLRCVEAGGAKRIVFASSGGSVYGENDYGRPIKETDPVWPISPYGIGKLTIENYLHYFDRVHSQRYTVFRIANPYGDRQSIAHKQGVIPIFLNKIINKEPVTVFGNGSMVRDYIYIKDVAKIIVASLGKNLKHSVYNLGSGCGYSVNEIVSEIEKVTNEKAIIKHEPTPLTFVQSSILDTARLKAEFPDFKKTDLHTGIKYTYNNLNTKRLTP